MRTLMSPRQQHRSPSAWDPFSAFSDMRRQMDDFIYGVLHQQRAAADWRPSVDVDEDEQNFTIRMGVPGWKENDIHVEVDENVLTVRGQHDSSAEPDKNGQQAHWQRSFSQSLSLPQTIDAEKITADLDKGLLTICLPKKPQVEPKKITVTNSTNGKTK